MSILKSGEACRLSETESTSLTIPEGFTSIGWRAFEDCDTPAKITIPEVVTKVDNFAFYNTKPKHWNLPNSLEIIGRYAFHDSSIKSINFGANLKKIGSNAFTGNRLKKVTLPEKTKLAEEAFDDDVIIRRLGTSSKSEPGSINPPSQYRVKYIDKITNFNPKIDTLEIDIDSFGIDRPATFAAARNKKMINRKLAKFDIDFLYDQKKGGLYFNENGLDRGFGNGGIVAIIKGAPDLTASNLEFI